MRMVKRVGHLESMAYQIWDTGLVDRFKIEQEFDRGSVSEETTQEKAPEGMPPPIPNPNQASQMHPEWFSREEPEYTYVDVDLFRLENDKSS